MRQALIFALLLAVPQFIAAECGPSQRISVDDADCLTGEFENHTWPKKDTAWVKSECSRLGTVVAKVDRAGAADWTKWLEGAGKVNMSGAYGNIRGISCCKDVSDLCIKSEFWAEKAEECKADFNESPATQVTSYACSLDTSRGDREGVKIWYKSDPLKCRVFAKCYDQSAEGSLEPVETDASCPFEDIKNITVDDNGHLKCP